uniref:Uncharacterized protein n=1 Tax=Gossypium raimondii TaxID=29730 RepID=A0A0D2Q0B9_GOSRA|nr:hypothetical protein B456_005G223400 [Gossypium raimondii]KJB32953.1 hypothetical protein B456_005G223400 [Gossypium raimondii]
MLVFPSERNSSACRFLNSNGTTLSSLLRARSRALKLWQEDRLAGTGPWKLLEARRSEVTWAIAEQFILIGPSRLLLCRSILKSEAEFTNEAGNDPVNLFELAEKDSSFLSLPKTSGRLPLKSFKEIGAIKKTYHFEELQKKDFQI